MRVVFRVDASSVIGSGHVMRCLTLAHAIVARGGSAAFICREHAGHLCALLESRGFATFRLPVRAEHCEAIDDQAPAHAAWLGAPFDVDAKQTVESLRDAGPAPDWLVVDHYGVDERWETAVQSLAGRTLAIDDLADRSHCCEILLDQNLNAEMPGRYDGLLREDCKTLLGPRYALLQPDYAELHSLTPPRGTAIKTLFIYFGAADRGNLTGMALTAIEALARPDLQVEVVYAAEGPHGNSIREQAARSPNIHLHSGLRTLAPLMARSDLAIGAGGATNWERLCLGLPALVVTLAENQRPLASYMHARQLIRLLGDAETVQATDILQALQQTLAEGSLLDWSLRCRQICDGQGVDRVIGQMVAGRAH